MDKIMQVKNEVRLNEWSGMVKACIDSGLTVAEWCKVNGINIKTYYYRLRRVRESLYELKEHREIIPVSAVTTSTAPEAYITIRTNKITLELPADISKETLCAAIEVLKC